jgi:acyl-CoA dehydrogenase
MLESGQFLEFWGLVGATALILAYRGAPYWLWCLAALGLSHLGGVPQESLQLIAGVLLVSTFRPIRRFLASAPLLKLIRALNIMPKISETERVALEAGATWVDGELFSGRPNFKKINAEPVHEISDEERAFINGPTNKVCELASDWEIFNNHDLPENVWAFIKRERFFGMIIPKEYGGLGFSATAHSEIIQKLTSRSIPLAVTVMVPNSLGPAELILHYGTEKQKNHYLPRLADGREIPCFALTEPMAGSDAGSITSGGEVFKDSNGQLCIKLNWDKRYITLAAVSTLIGLAIKLHDPKNLLGRGEDLGITCVLVPSSTAGVVLGERHNPMGVPFFNCPTSGKDVVVGIDQIIGGAEGAGHGWRMLMESLAAGRAISLPAQSLGTSKLTTRVTSAYAVIREQFGITIGKFEGVEERLARIFGLTYLMESTRQFTASAVDNGVKPAVVSAIAKCYMTELSRIVINDGMDVLGGAGISRGPRNLLANPYIGAPIGITVEGANILTRSMIIFGQGALRCHPFAYREFSAVGNNDLKEFDAAFWGHVGHVIKNSARVLVSTLTRGYLIRAPLGSNRRHYQKLVWASSVFALMSDVAMGTLGGQLKFREKLTGRFSDILAWMYIATATLRKAEADGRPSNQQAFVNWSIYYALNEIQNAFDNIFKNLNVPVIGWFFRVPIAFWSRLNRFSTGPSDHASRKIVAKILIPSELRDQLTSGIFLCESDENEQLNLYERAFEAAANAAKTQSKIRSAMTQGLINKKLPLDEIIQTATALNLISDQEADNFYHANQLRREAIDVDSFSLDEFSSALMETRRLKLS